ncbi:hypothetical protein LINGRAHAP2_LOCUS5031 [Linum grandiflorum]
MVPPVPVGRKRLKPPSAHLVPPLLHLEQEAYDDDFQTTSLQSRRQTRPSTRPPESAVPKSSKNADAAVIILVLIEPEDAT